MIAKLLEWVPSPMTNDIGERSTRYGASPMTNIFYWIFEGSRGFVLQGRGTFRTLAAAQEAAQAEWEARVSLVVDQPVPFQARVQPWMMECFGPMIAGDREERNHRFLEEALELVQACGCTASEAHQLVDYVFGRPVGEPHQEAGGVMVTHAALCLANGLDMHEAGETELARIWTKVEAIRAKHAAKPKHSPLPGPSADQKICPACGGTRRLGPYFPGGMSTICGNCTATEATGGDHG